MGVDLQALRHSFSEHYGGAPRLFRAPGRINLIGEHTDYNDGFVLPIAINRETVVAGKERLDLRVRVLSLNLNEAAEFSLEDGRQTSRPTWLGYVEGVARTLKNRGAPLRGADLLIFSDIPMGAGLSSSAALAVAVGWALLSLVGADVDGIGLALAAQRAEHEYVGIKSGIMDQYISALGQAGHALLLDCRALQATPVPLDTSTAVLAICNTGVKHELASSEYNRRRAECERGVELLRRCMPGIHALRDVEVAEFERYKDRLPEPIRRRCRHVVTEDNRTLKAAGALRANDLQAFGELMYESHRSLRDDFEVSCLELDALVEIARSVEGVSGARMTGGGFGGCTISMVRRDRIENFREAVTRGYNAAFGREAGFFVSEAMSGANEIL